MPRTEIGFFDTADKFAAAVASLDASVQRLRESVDAAPDGGGIDAEWRVQFSAFCRRWELERDEYGPWAARLMLLEPNARLERFQEAYLWWATDFERKSKRAVPAKAATEQESASESMIPTALWVVLGLGVIAFAYARGR